MDATHTALHTLKVADEAFLVVAQMHRDQPDREDFAVTEILDQARSMNLYGHMRPGLEIHIRQHCVANLPPNPGRYRMLFASGKARRRLLRPGDSVDAGRRSGKIWPDLADVPGEWRELVAWAKARFGMPPVDIPWLDAVIQLRGSGKDVWKDESADEYIKRLRDEWA